MTPFLGILMLQTRFPRPPGDIGHPQTFAFPVRRVVVEDAVPRRVVHGNAVGLLDRFIASAQALVGEGACAIGTSCGFLALHQRELAAALPAPVATSSLLQCAWLAPLLPAGRRCGIVTIDAAALTDAHLAAVGAAADTPIEGVDRDGEFATRLLNDEPTLDTTRAEAEVVEAARRLVRRRADVGAIVLECTNMPPYAAAVARATGRPVFDVVTLLNWLWSGVARAEWTSK
ncbi:MAG: aspartate/glutamate racemase family protein [Gemmatimonadota bacterium]